MLFNRKILRKKRTLISFELVLDCIIPTLLYLKNIEGTDFI